MTFYIQHVDTVVAFLKAKEYVMTAEDKYIFDEIVNLIITRDDIDEFNICIAHNQQLMEENACAMLDLTLSRPKYCDHRETYHDAKYICDELMKHKK